MNFTKLVVFFAPMVFTQICAFSNEDIVFDRTIEEAEKRWVICPPLEDKSYQFGFVFDLGDGLTFKMEGAFKIKNDSIFERIYGKDINPRPNLTGSSDSVALVPENKQIELGIGQFPDWYEAEPENEGRKKNVFEWYTKGYVHNKKGEYAKAKVPLEQAYQLNPDFKNLRLQLALTYNALKIHQKALPLLEKAITLEPKNYQLYQALSHAQLLSGEVSSAEKNANKGIKLCKINPPRCQMALTLAYQFYDNKDKRKLKKWLRESRKYALDGGRQAKQIGEMLEESYSWDKK
jgi:tetratricopeptide (TPR) repeat protein